ncbi:MAG: dienelactone hydrolase family protein [Rhodospirillales bacterium]|nr:dienelactone hydrolase family protein [Rhodospirillales bacterium]
MALVATPAAAESVHFPSATTPPSPLQQRLAHERGQVIEPQPSVKLAGELYRPPGDGPFPAVVMLHGCDGRLRRAVEDTEGARFTALGYALLTVDSFGPRGVKERCRVEDGPPVDRVMDAYGALLYLASLPFIDADRIAVLGYSQGAMVALSAVELHGVGTLFDRHFRAAIAYYPYCTNALAVSAPTVILIGERDDWTPAHACRRDMARRSGEGAPVRLIVYPDAYHAFNFQFAKPITVLGHHIESNEAATRAAWAETVAALRAAFGR